ncbi:hypothetical protein AB0A70_04955 [Streptomyces morookaense]|uniref:hypothetical protein n=1 Tax=Streptomyces morookaense TaxID=1970 RepID=UPI0033C20EA0
MALWLKTVRFTDVNGAVANTCTVKSAERLNFPGKVREDLHGRRVIDVALKSFSLGAYFSGKDEDFEIGYEKVSVSLDYDDFVSLTVQLRPRPDEARRQEWQFRADAEVLVIADLEDAPRP